MAFSHFSFPPPFFVEASIYTPNLGTLFLAVTSTENPLTVGVVYRPPSGNTSQAIIELSNIIDCLPKTNVHFLGDFNIANPSRYLSSHMRILFFLQFKCQCWDGKSANEIFCTILKLQFELCPCTLVKTSVCTTSTVGQF